MERTFRIGPIRPPSEAESLLLQVTNGCTWNKCKFCQLYRHTKFKAYSADSIKADIDNMVYQAQVVEQYRNGDGTWDIDGINAELMKGTEDERQCLYMMANWIIDGAENVFLAGRQHYGAEQRQTQRCADISQAGVPVDKAYNILRASRKPFESKRGGICRAEKSGAGQDPFRI